MRLLTRKELYEFDSSPLYAGANALRFLCPSDECRDKPRDNTHRSFTVRDDNVAQCFRCGMKGRLGDEQKRMTPMKRDSKPPYRRNIRDAMR